MQAQRQRNVPKEQRMNGSAGRQVTVQQAAGRIFCKK
jgi:hypothetical protein